MKFDWAATYRPKLIGECVLPKRIKDPLLLFEAQRRFPHLLFYGQPGLGKTTAAEALAAGQDTFRMEGAAIKDLKPVRQFMGHYGFRRADIKIIILDEASRLKANTFSELNMWLEKEFLQTALIATINDPHHFDASLRSRFIEFDFSPRPDENRQLMQDMADRCEFILHEKKCFAIPRREIESLVRDHYPDLRQVIKRLYMLYTSRMSSGS